MSTIGHVGPVRLLIADDDAAFRTLTVARAIDVARPRSLAVHEAENGAEATRIAVHRRPHIALLDVNMPRLGGIEAAITLRDLLPQLRLALYTADPRACRTRARDLRLPLFDKRDVQEAIGWVEAQVDACRASTPLQRHGLECSACGYGIARAVLPPRCPMCRREETWVDARRPVSGARAAAWL